MKELFNLFSINVLPLVFTLSVNIAQKDINTPVTPPADMVFVKGGTFQMGCTAEQGDDCYDWEKPVHTVVLSDFYISKYEVTQKQWREVMGNNPSGFKGCDDCPVERVSWNDVQTFIEKLNALNAAKGIKGRYCLPTEAQWEYAARGGQLSKGYKYSGSNNIDEVAWYNDNNGDKTHPVGSKRANELGLYDMSGNVWEWCSDRYGIYSNVLQQNPTGAVEGTRCVYRGGSWNYFAQYCRPTYRNRNTPADRYADLGCRLGWFPL